MSTILLVDDEKPVREFLALALEQEGHSVVQAIHGQQAMELILSATTKPDLVVCDVMMPLMSGVELCRVLKEDPATDHIPIVLMSAAHPRTSAGSGADALISKPFDLDILDALIADLLTSRDSASL